MDIEDIKAALIALKFTSKDELSWRRSFPAGAEVSCELATSLVKSKVVYPKAMVAGRTTTQSFAQAESLVVLDCVCRLLEQGYSPDSIVLEKSYTVGHNPKYLDVLIMRQGAPYMMIECKTPGAEFDAECKRLARDGGQVLTYFAQDRNAEWLVVYTAKVSNGQIKAKYLGLHAQVLAGSSVPDLYSSWDKATFSTGLFASAPYAFKEPSLLVKDLEAMTQEQGLSVFNEFEEILRRHVVSDKPNAFNKIFNLFICKVYDEQKINPSAELDFQWRKGELPDTVLSRLTDLYRKGMLEFLKLEVADHSDAEISELLAHATEDSRAAIRRAFVELRLYKTNEFAFLDVFDRQTFLRNAEIVRDVVTLLQKKRLRYKQKQPFMGDFFERLLATSVKQESGQFFTPLPIARFMLEALPVETVIDKKLQSDNEKFLPYILDYASGSGHFLTEAMDRVDKVIKKISDTDERLTRQKLRSNLSSWKSDYSWAGEFVYGIERDYRLAKTAKVSCFLNGDGEANVIRANGLDSFQNSKDYQAAGGFLSVNDDRQDNPKFDVIVANPPYSVKNFKSTVTDGAASFSLWNQLGESSKEIELLFIERTKQLMKPGGVAAIVLPNSVLQTSGAAASARMLLIRSFEIISVVTLGPGTFMKTGIGTVILFLRRRGNHDVANAAEAARQIVEGNTSAATALAKAYAKEVHDTDLATFKQGLEEPHSSSLPAFVEEIRRHAESASLKALEKSASFRVLTKAKQQAARQADLKSFVQKDQLRRLEIFALTRGQTVLAVNAPADAKEEIRFLGYKFSERRGRAGMQYTSGEEHIDTPLFDPTNIASSVKIAPLIRGLYETGKVKVPSALEKYCHTLSAAELFDYEEQPFEATVQTRKVEPALAYLVKTERLGSICDVRIGGTPSRAMPKYFKNGKNLWVGIKEMAGQKITSTTEMITDEAVKSSNVKLIPVDTTLVSFKLSVGKTARAGVPLYTNEAIAALVILPAFVTQVSNDYLFALFTLFGQEVMSLNNVASLKLGKILNKGALKNIPIPILKPTDMAKFCAEFKKHGSAAKTQLAKLLW